MERSEIVSQILAILEDVAEISPEDVTEDSVLMDDLDLSSMEILGTALCFSGHRVLLPGAYGPLPL